MHVLLVGFGRLARELSKQIKSFPEYGTDKDISIYHIFVRRNSLSYGKNLVVEIPDPHGDGYRTYKDGFQALPNYSTTVSNYKPWLLGEAEKGAFHVVVDCTTIGRDSKLFIDEIMDKSAGKAVLISANKIGIDATISELRQMLDGGQPWEPVQFSEEFLKEASDAWATAQVKMMGYHASNKRRDIAKRFKELNGVDISTRKSCFIAIPEFDRGLIDRFVVDGDPHEEYFRKVYYNFFENCLVIKHDILDKFLGWHHTEQLACVAFLNPNLEIESAVYIKYLNATKKHIDFSKADYVIEHIHRGKMIVIDEDEARAELSGDGPASSYSYRPSINPPFDVSIEAGTEIIVFTYKEKQK
jgi:hypothetical protein